MDELPFAETCSRDLPSTLPRERCAPGVPVEAAVTNDGNGRVLTDSNPH